MTKISSKPEKPRQGASGICRTSFKYFWYPVMLPCHVILLFSFYWSYFANQGSKMLKSKKLEVENNSIKIENHCFNAADKVSNKVVIALYEPNSPWIIEQHKIEKFKVQRSKRQKEPFYLWENIEAAYQLKQGTLWVVPQATDSTITVWDLPNFEKILKTLIYLLKTMKECHLQCFYLIGYGKGGTAVL